MTRTKHIVKRVIDDVDADEREEKEEEEERNEEDERRNK
jgi:hypothetical protein